MPKSKIKVKQPFPESIQFEYEVDIYKLHNNGFNLIDTAHYGCNQFINNLVSFVKIGKLIKITELVSAPKEWINKNII